MAYLDSIEDGAVIVAVVTILGVGFASGRHLSQLWPVEKGVALDGDTRKRRKVPETPRSDVCRAAKSDQTADSVDPHAVHIADDSSSAGGRPHAHEDSPEPQRFSALREAYFVESVSPEQPELMAGARVLSQEAFEEEPRTQKGQRVAVLVLGDEVVAYVAYVARPSIGSFNINKLAVSSARRRLGLGRRLVKETVQLARRTQKEIKGSSKRGQGPPPIEAICLSALPTAIKFYKACGFHELPDVRLPDGDLEEGQVYMELPLRRRRK